MKVEPVIDIDINVIFYMLHELAVAEAKKVNSSIEIENIAVNTQDKTFVGPGEYLLIAKLINEDEDTPDIQVFLDVLCKYVEFFCGEDEAKKIKKEQLKDIKITVQSESIHPTCIKPLCETLFLEAPTSEKIIGYTITYDVNLSNKKLQSKKTKLQTSINNATKYISKSFKKILSGIGSGLVKIPGLMLKALSKINFNTYGSGTINIGKRDDTKDDNKNNKKQDEPIKFKQAFDQITNDKYPNNTLDLVIIDDITDLELKLKQQHKITSDIKTKIEKLNTVIGCNIQHNDKHYYKYNEKTIAELINASSKINKNELIGKISENDILKFQNFKMQTDYVLTNKDPKNNSLNTDDNKNDANESTKYICNKIMQILFEAPTSSSSTTKADIYKNKLIKYLNQISISELEQKLKYIKDNKILSNSMITIATADKLLVNVDTFIEMLLEEKQKNRIENFFNNVYKPVNTNIYGILYAQLNNFALKISNSLSNKSGDNVILILTKLSNNLSNEQCAGDNTIKNKKMFINKLTNIANSTNSKNDYLEFFNNEYIINGIKLEYIYNTLQRIYNKTIDKDNTNKNDVKTDFYLVTKTISNKNNF